MQVSICVFIWEYNGAGKTTRCGRRIVLKAFGYVAFRDFGVVVGLGTRDCDMVILLFFKDNFGSKLSSFTNSKSGGTSNSATLTSRIGGGDSHGVKRLHSTTSEDEHELDDRRAGRDVPKHGGIERTTMYHTSHEQTSRDDVRLVHQGYRNDGKNQWDV